MKIIINADDIGLSDNVNKTIIMMHEKGIVSSTTLMAFGSHFEDAVNLLRQHPNLGTGVHLCLDGPFNSGTDYETIIDPESGHFYNTHDTFRKIKYLSFDNDEIFKEYCLQIEKVLDYRIKVSHLDTHHHLHLYIPILRQVIKAAKKYKIPFIRSQKLLTCTRKSPINDLYRIFHQAYLKIQVGTISGYFEPALTDCPDFEKNYARLKKLFSRKRGIWDLMVHPIHEDDPETSFFSDQKIMALLKSQEIINYHHLSKC